MFDDIWRGHKEPEKKKKKPSYNKHMTQFYVIWLLYISRGEKVTIKGQPTYMEFSQFLY